MILTSNWNTPFLRATHRHGAIEFEKGRINNILALPTRVLSPPEMWHGEFGSSSGRKQITREIIDFFFFFYADNGWSSKGWEARWKREVVTRVAYCKRLAFIYLFFYYYSFFLSFDSLTSIPFLCALLFFLPFRRTQMRMEGRIFRRNFRLSCLFFFLLLFTWSK
jgi:hypothetical protein